MTLGVWFVRRLSKWLLGAFLLTCFLVVLVEGVESGHPVSQGRTAWGSLLWERLFLVLRDVLPLCFVFGAGGLALQMRRGDFVALRVCGVSPVRLHCLALLSFLAWSAALSAAVDRGIMSRSSVQDSSLVRVDGRVHLVSLDESGLFDSLSVELQEDGLFLKKGELSNSQLRDWYILPNPAEASMAQLARHPHERASEWLFWRRLGAVLPGLVGALTFALCLTPSLSWGWAVSWSAGATLALHWFGSLAVRNAWFAM